MDKRTGRGEHYDWRRHKNTGTVCLLRVLRSCFYDSKRVLSAIAIFLFTSSRSNVRRQSRREDRDEKKCKKIELKCKIVGLIGRPLRDTAVPYTLESPFHDKHFVADSSLLYIALLRNYKASKLTILTRVHKTGH